MINPNHPVIQELLKLNPPFVILIQAAYMQADPNQKAKLILYFPKEIAEVR
jgi:hypothetical protein